MSRMHAVALLLASALVDVMPAEAPEDASLAGRYGLVLDVGARVDLPGVGPLDAQYQSLLLVDVERRADGRVVHRHRTCDVVIKEDMPLIEAVVPPAALQSLRARTDPVTLGPQGAYRADLGRRDIGFVSSTDRMPKHRDDPAVLDPDGDGEPGVTLKLNLPVGGIDVHFVQRDHAVLVGRVLSPDLVEGSIDVRALEQNVLSTSPSLPDPQVVIVPKRDQATFKLFRVDAGADCRALKQTWQQQLAAAVAKTRGAEAEALARQP